MAEHDWQSTLQAEDWSNEPDREIPDDHPLPDFWRILILPVRPKKISKGGIMIAESARTAESVLNYIGQVVALGPLAYTSERFKLPDGSMIEPPKVGDIVIFGKYAGQPIEHRGMKFRFINDDEILGRVRDPEALRVHI